ncbi:MAG: hypothetical protein ACJ763_13850 [Bdellovibrionia bacterium]
MSQSVKATQPSSVNDVLLDSVNRRLVEAATRFAILLNRMGYPAQAYSESALQKVTVTPAPQKELIASHLESWSEWIEPLDPSKSYDNEISLLLRALAKHGFDLDEEFFKTIEKDQIIELYDEDMIQLYRSFNFYKITGYSILDISLYEWYVLWDRPRQSLESIGAELQEALKTYIPVKPFQTKTHLVREIFNAAKSENFKPRAALLTPVRLGTLMPKPFSTNNKKGFICTSTGEMIAIGKDAQNIEFI